MHFINTHPVVSALAAYFLLSNLVDAFAKVPPVAGGSRLYLFAYTFFQGFAGNLITALKFFLSKKA